MPLLARNLRKSDNWPCLFLIVWQARNRIVFTDDFWIVATSFACLYRNWNLCFFFWLCSETKLSIENGRLTLVRFVDWMECK